MHTSRRTSLALIAALAILPTFASIAHAECPYQWYPPGAPPSPNRSVNALCTWTPATSGSASPLLIFAGDFDSIPGVGTRPFIAAWDGSNCLPLGTGLGSWAWVVSTHAGELIAGGSFRSAGGTLANYIAAWNGTAWRPLGSGMSRDVRALITYNGELIAGGEFWTAGGTPANQIARWNGSEWFPLGLGVNGTVYALEVFNSELIAAGWFSSAGGIAANNIARWNGTAWLPLGAGTDGSITDLKVVGGELVASGAFSIAGTSAFGNVAGWNGSSWRSFGQPSLGSFVYALEEYNGQLIAGGNFITADHTISGVARWNGSTWQPLGSGTIASIYGLTTFDGQLIAGGPIILAGGFPLQRIARWGPSLELPSITQKPTNKKVLAGSAATFTLASAGGQPLSYQWRKDNANLTDDGHILGATTDTLTINAASGADVGLYDCVVSNDCGAATSSAARLTVIANVPTGPRRPFEPSTAIAD